VKLVDVSRLDYDQAAEEAHALAIGSPDYFSYVAGQIKTFFDKTLYDERFHGKAYVGFGTHGGGAKVLGVLDRLAQSCKLRRVAAGLMIQGGPEGEPAEQARQLGKTLAEAAG
jgi:multimeric flavodoxin WrbA